jgi:hypothetical protein
LPTRSRSEEKKAMDQPELDNFISKNGELAKDYTKKKY